MVIERQSLLGMTQDELVELATGRSWPAHAGRQLAQWIYKHGEQDFARMTNLSQKIRGELAGAFVTGLQKPSLVRKSADGTKKYLFPVSSGGQVEAVYIPEGKRHTLCVSTQLGCRMGCRFCMTGRQGLGAQLTAGEILNQVLSIPEAGLLTNIVYMGMGEPLDNLDQVLKSLDILCAGYGMGMSPRRITVSTIGMLPALDHFLQKSRCRLAVSLHSPFEEERRKLVPMEKAHPLMKILDSIRRHPDERQRRISFEYIVFKDLNHSQAHVNALARILRGIRCRINLIRFHPLPGSPLQPPDPQSVISFREALEARGLTCTIRKSRGQDIEAACGMLSTRERK